MKSFKKKINKLWNYKDKITVLKKNLSSIKAKKLASFWVKLVLRTQMEEIKVYFIIILALFLLKEKKVKEGIHWIYRLSWTPLNSKKKASKNCLGLISN